MIIDEELLPEALGLYTEIGQVLVWAQNIPSSGIRYGAYQVCIGLLTNPIRLSEILKGKKTLRDFVKNNLEKNCPMVSLELIESWAKRFLEVFRGEIENETPNVKIQAL
jgi:hypothetical protein